METQDTTYVDGLIADYLYEKQLWSEDLDTHPEILKLQEQLCRTRKLTIGIQGSFGSNNHMVFNTLVEKYALEGAIPKFLGTTAPVLDAVNSGEVDAGIFAMRTRNKGIVEMTERALEKHPCTPIDLHVLKIRHNLFAIKKLADAEYKKIASHPQALMEHWPYLKDFSNAVELHESDTSGAAKKLARGEYSESTLVIAPEICQEIYNTLISIRHNLPPDNYKTMFSFVTKGMAWS